MAWTTSQKMEKGYIGCVRWQQLAGPRNGESGVVVGDR